MNCTFQTNAFSADDFLITFKILEAMNANFNQKIK